MLISCKHCGHKLWSEVVKVGVSHVMAHFDDDERSDTYAEHVPDCPECGSSLDRGIPAATPGPDRPAADDPAVTGRSAKP